MTGDGGGEVTMREIFLKKVRPEVSPKRAVGSESMVEMRQAGAGSCRA